MTGTAPAGLVVAIDGPAGSGKSTLGAALAERLGYTYFDSGVVYRALTWAALDRAVSLDDEAALVQLARQVEIAVRRPTVQDGRQATVLVDGRDVTWDLRSAAVDQHVSRLSAYPNVRDAANERLRTIAAGGAIVMVGRDIGTVVLPDADLKVYLTATPEERARRRQRELQARNEPAEYAEILRDMRRRDAYDAGRAAAPMRPADDAVRLDSDDLTVEQEVDEMVRLLDLR